MSGNDLFHAFLGLATHVAERNKCHLTVDHDIEVGSGHARHLSILFSSPDQRFQLRG